MSNGPSGKQVFSQANATPLEIAEELISLYGKEWVDWEPETLWRAIWGEHISEGSDIGYAVGNSWTGPGNQKTQSHIREFLKNKIMAIKVVLSNDLFWKDWFTFEKCCMAFNNVTPRFDMIEHPSPAMMAYAVRVAIELARMPLLRRSGRERVFALEVKSYIANQAFLEGVVYLPQPLNFAQSKLDEFTGMAGVAKTIATRVESGIGEVDETPEGVGVVRALVIKKYAYDNKRKPLI